MFKILYNGVNPFEGIGPTPLVQRSIEPIHYAKKYGEIEKYTLTGFVVGECLSEDMLSDLLTKSNALVTSFSAAFKNFSIIEDDAAVITELYPGGKATIRSINFEDSEYSYLLPYSIELDVYNEASFGAYFGVLDPSKTIDFQEQENGTITINKTVSAAGINTDVSALINAVTFVQGEAGLDLTTKPLFLADVNLENAVLVSSSEDINRLTAEYSLKESWVYDPNGATAGSSLLYKSTIDTSSGEGGVNITLKGEIFGGLNNTIESMRLFLQGIDAYQEVESHYIAGGFSAGLSPEPVSKQISESGAENKITFSYVFTDNVQGDPYIVDSISINKDFAGNKTCVSVQITIKSVEPCLSTRKTNVLNYYNSFNLLNFVVEKLAEYGHAVVLPGKFTSSGYSINEKTGFISVSGAVCEKKIDIPEDFLDFNYVVDFTPSVHTFVPFQGVDSGGEFTIQRLLGVRRRVVSISGNAVKEFCSSEEDASASLLTHVNQLKDIYINNSKTFLSEHQIKIDKNSFSFSFSWNEDGDVELDENKTNSPFPV